MLISLDRSCSWNSFCRTSSRRLYQKASEAVILIIDIVCIASCKSDTLLSPTATNALKMRYCHRENR